MPTVVVIATILLSSNFECIQLLDNESSNPPLAAKVYRHNITRTIIELHGGHIVLQCDDREYTANLLEDK